jgi:twitching motility protein PilJ
MSTQSDNFSNINQPKASPSGNSSLNNKSRVSSVGRQNGRSSPKPISTDKRSPNGRSPQRKPTGNENALGQWFANLPIARKQLVLAGVSSVAILGFIGAGALIVSQGLREQFLLKSQSENAAVDINYKIKINQMGFGSRGQSDNAAIIGAAVEDAKTNSLKPELQTQVKKILQNEVKARNMEYATLVGKDLRIIVNANANRQGEIFNPEGLVAEIFQDTRQIKATAIASWNELKKEAPPLPEGFANEDALIRYTVTPVFDPATKQPIAALVFGDIVNGKLPIVANTLKAFNGGYSAVYLRQPNGEFTLASALHQSEGASLDNAHKNEPLPDTSLLAKAIATPGKAVSGEMKIEEESLAVSALAIPNIYKEEAQGPVPVAGRGEPIAVLVRGTSEAALGAILRNSLLAQAGLGVLVLALNGVLAVVIGRAIAKPIEELQQATQKFAAGDRRSRAEVASIDEVGRLSGTFNQLADGIVANEAALKEEAAKLEQARQETEKLAEQERQRSAELQGELLRFLTNVEGASQGDLTVRADISAGEIGIVADLFNSIVESVRDIVAQVKQAATQVGGSVGKNETAIQRLADEALQQAAQINKTLDSVETMTRSIQQVAENAKMAAEVARSASDTAETSGEDMELTVSSILQLRETVTETAKKIKRLGEASQQISKAVSLINQIAMQTNLLAVNASIEAARAGEEGQGFAVVAAEVGQLAAQSAAATKEIEQIVDAIQQETTAAIKAIKVSTTQVEEGTRLAEKAKQSLEKIVLVSRQIDRLLQSISRETVSQVNTSEMVAQLMEEIAQVSEKTSDSSHQVSSALQETVEITKQLQASVGTFKVA